MRHAGGPCDHDEISSSFSPPPPLSARWRCRPPAPATFPKSRPALSPTSSVRKPSSPARPPERIFAGDHGRDARRQSHYLGAWTTGSIARGRDVTVTLFGFGRSHAVYREGFGCYLDHGDAVADTSLPAAEIKPSQVLLPDIAGAFRGCTANAATGGRARSRLCRARTAAAAPHQGGGGRERRPRRRRALCRGHGIDTPILGFSATKSVISALTGILVRKGALTLDEPVPIAAWQGAGDAKACDHARSSAAPHRGAGARQFAAGVARRPRWSRSTG